MLHRLLTGIDATGEAGVHRADGEGQGTARPDHGAASWGPLPETLHNGQWRPQWHCWHCHEGGRISGAHQQVGHTSTFFSPVFCDMYKTMSVFYLHFLQSNTFLSCVILIAISEHFCASGLSDSVAFRSVPLHSVVLYCISPDFNRIGGSNSKSGFETMHMNNKTIL